MSITKQVLLTTTLIATFTVPAVAKEMKEVTSIVGYNVTETQTFTGPKADLFNKMDANRDGFLTFKEYANYSTLDNEYDAFARMDKDQNKNVSYEEFANFDNTGKGETEFESQLHGKASVKGTNLKVRILEEPKTYYVPVQPEVVNVEVVEPAAK